MKNYNTMKNEELHALMEKYELEKADYLNPENGSLNRKKLSNILRLIDATAGKETETIVVTDEGQVDEYEPKTKLAKGLSGMMVLITFYLTNENDLPYVQLALNGTALIVPREKETWIPKEFVDGVLVNAITTKMKMVVTSDGKIKYEPRNVPRFQYTVKDIKHIDALKKEYDEKQKNKK